MANNNSPTIDIHADDYALSPNTSREMLELMHDGILDSISIIPNMTCFDECMDMLKCQIPDLPFLPKMSVHLNLVEGLRLSGSDNTHETPLIQSTWKSLFLASYDPMHRNTVKNQLRSEISAQIKRVQPLIDECIRIAISADIPCAQARIRIDSHQHTHMIPVVWDALCECLEADHLEPEYIRNSKEPLTPFLKKPSLIPSYGFANPIKNRILSFYSARPDRWAEKNGADKMYLWGLMMSGRMDAERIKTLYPLVTSTARQDRRSLEVLFHPGQMLAEEATNEVAKAAADDFYLSDNRSAEKKGARCAHALNVSRIIKSDNRYTRL